MANICETTYVFYGKISSVTKLYNFLVDIQGKCNKDGIAVKQQDGSELICHYPNFYLLQEALNIPEKDMARGRGDITYIEEFDVDDDGAFFSLYMEEAWEPHPEIWENIIRRRFTEDIKIAYRAEEPGCELYYIFDPERRFFDDKFVLTGYLGGDSIWENFDTEKDCYTYALRLVQSFCTKEHIAFSSKLFPDLDKLFAFIEEHTADKDDYYLSLHEYQYAA